MSRYITGVGAGGLGPVTLHSDMPLEDLAALVAEYEDEDGPEAGNVVQEYTTGLTKQPTCFYGWGEPQSDEHCLPHTMVAFMNNREYDPRDLARAIIDAGYQVVISDAHDWSIQPSTSTTPCFYLASHEH